MAAAHAASAPQAVQHTPPPQQSQTPNAAQQTTFQRNPQQEQHGNAGAALMAALQAQRMQAPAAH